MTLMPEVASLAGEVESQLHFTLLSLCLVLVMSG